MMLAHSASARFRRGPFLDRRAARAATVGAIDDYSIRTTGPDQPIGRLSGGNQQKLVLARELLDSPQVLLAAHPSRGLDIRTIALVQERLRAARDGGTAVLLVSADLGEIWRLADRVMVFAAGAMRGPVAIVETDRAEIGAWMAGH
jgi:simple sugar transport system ATP-binding protein